MFFSFLNWLRRPHKAQPLRRFPGTARPRSVQPEIEQLEKRWLLTAGITEYSLPFMFLNAHEITSGPDTNLWLTSGGGSKIAKLTTAGTFTVYSTNHTPYDICPLHRNPWHCRAHKRLRRALKHRSRTERSGSFMAFGTQEPTGMDLLRTLLTITGKFKG